MELTECIDTFCHFQRNSLTKGIRCVQKLVSKVLSQNYVVCEIFLFSGRIPSSPLSPVGSRRLDAPFPVCYPKRSKKKRCNPIHAGALLFRPAGPYSGRAERGENRETGANPVRSRRCKEGTASHAPLRRCPAREGEEPPRSPSQKTCLPVGNAGCHGAWHKVRKNVRKERQDSLPLPLFFVPLPGSGQGLFTA